MSSLMTTWMWMTLHGFKLDCYPIYLKHSQPRWHHRGLMLSQSWTNSLSTWQSGGGEYPKLRDLKQWLSYDMLFSCTRNLTKMLLKLTSNFISISYTASYMPHTQCTETLLWEAPIRPFAGSKNNTTWGSNCMWKLVPLFFPFNALIISSPIASGWISYFHSPSLHPFAFQQPRNIQWQDGNQVLRIVIIAPSLHPIVLFHTFFIWNPSESLQDITWINRSPPVWKKTPPFRNRPKPPPNPHSKTWR